MCKPPFSGPPGSLDGTSHLAWVRRLPSAPLHHAKRNSVPSPRAANQGIVTILPFRGDHMDTRHLQRMGDLGVAVPVPFSPRDEDSIRRATENSDIVINLIGKVRAHSPPPSHTSADA